MRDIRKGGLGALENEAEGWDLEFSVGGLDILSLRCLRHSGEDDHSQMESGILVRGQG